MSGPDAASAAFAARFLARVPPDVAASFTPAQLQAVQRAFGLRYAMAHAVDLRRRLRLPWGTYYVVLLAGRDARDARPGAVRRAALAVAAGMGLCLIAAGLT